MSSKLKSGELILSEILDVLRANSGFLSTYEHAGTTVNLLAAQNVLPTANMTTSQSIELWNLQYKGVYLFLNIGAVPGGGQTLQLFIDALNPNTGGYYAIAQGAALATPGLRAYLVYPGAVDTDGEMTHLTQLPLPRRWRIRTNHSGAGIWNYGIGIQYLV